MNSNHWSALLAILVILTAGCANISGTSKNAPELTKTADLYESLSMFDGYLEKSTQDWNINSSFCGSGTCRQQIISADGDTIEVTLTRYTSASDAETAFNSLKKGQGEHSVKEEKIADSGYV